MKAFFDNVWTKRVVSVIAAFYTVCVCYLCYYSIYYNIHVEQRGSVAMIVSAVSVIALVLMLYTRKQIVTRICSFIILPAMLPVVLMYFDHKEILIPVIAVGVVILLLSGAGEGAKTAIGTVVLLLYIFGALGYFLFTSFFVTNAKQETYKSGESPSGLYRYRIVNTDDSSNGSTAIYIEPNYADVTYPFVTFTLKNMERVVYQVRPKCENIELSWSTQTRQQITGELNSISDDIAVHVTRAEMASLGYRYDTTLEISDVLLVDIGAGVRLLLPPAHTLEGQLDLDIEIDHKIRLRKPHLRVFQIGQPCEESVQLIVGELASLMDCVGCRIAVREDKTAMVVCDAVSFEFFADPAIVSGFAASVDPFEDDQLSMCHKLFLL